MFYVTEVTTQQYHTTGNQDITHSWKGLETVLIAHAEDPSLAPSTHMVAHIQL